MTPARMVTVTGPNGLRGRIDTATWPSDGGQAKVLVQLDDGRQVRVPLEALHRQEDGRYTLQLDPAALEVRQSTGSHVSGRPLIVEVRRPVRVRFVTMGQLSSLSISSRASSIIQHRP